MNQSETELPQPALRHRVALRGQSVEPSFELLCELQSALGIQRITAELLARRGVGSIQAAQEFLSPTLREHLPDPGAIKNINEAAQMILDAVSKRRKITIYNDFDVDGLTAGASLLLFLRSIGSAVEAYVPSRFVEGYGLASAAVEHLARQGTELLLTVDCGITNVEQIALARRRGIDVVVLDHHLPGDELPPANVIVDPAQQGCPFQEHKLAAAGLVWMLLIVIRRLAREQGMELSIPDPKEFIDLAAIGTICDMVPLVGLNRLIALRGIEALRQQPRVGVQALKDVAKLNGTPRFGSGHVAFVLGPRINAAGRLGDASDVLTLLTTTDSKRAKSVAESIDKLNERRKLIEAAVRESCVRSLTDCPELSGAPAFALYDREYHVGVIGIAAQRLVEEFHRPAAVMAPGEMIVGGELTQVVKGSVRSIPGFPVAEVLRCLSGLLLAHGGHDAAGGFSLTFQNLEPFKEAFIAEARRRLSAEMLCRKVCADLKVELRDVDWQLAEELQRLSPFGIGNPSPLLYTEGVTIDTVTMLAQRHLKARLTDSSGCFRNAVAWNMYGHPLLRKGRQADIVYQIEVNTYHGISSVQLVLKEVLER